MPKLLGAKWLGIFHWYIPVATIDASGNPQLVSAASPIPVGPSPVPAATADFATQTAADAVITYAAVATARHVLYGVQWSYSGASGLPSDTAPGTINVQDGTNTVRSIDVTATGAGFLPFNPPIIGTLNTAMVVTLTNGGASVVGKINAQHSTQ